MEVATGRRRWDNMVGFDTNTQCVKSILIQDNQYCDVHKHLMLRRLVRGGGGAESLGEQLLHVLNDTKVSCTVIGPRTVLSKALTMREQIHFAFHSAQ